MATKIGKQWVWDVPTRLFHWSIVVLIGLSWWSARNGEMEWHYYSGLIICGLLIFRILWGIFGTSTARFRQFLKGPASVVAYLRGTGVNSVGHNPLGGWSVIAMLAAMAVQVITGLFSVDVDGIESGPLSYMIDFDDGRAFAAVHEVAFNILLVLMALHVAAILFYLIFKKANLVAPMIIGVQAATPGKNGAVRVPVWRIGAAAAIAVATALWISKGMPR